MYETELPQRFWDKVEPEPNTGCWLWGGGESGGGYGRFWNNGGMRSAHRVAYEDAKGPIPDGLQIDHLCRVPSCVNPRHLEPVTSRENISRSSLANLKTGVCRNGHKVTAAGSIITVSNGRQTCAKCNRIWWARYRNQNRLTTSTVIEGD